MNGKETSKVSDAEVCEAADKFTTLFYEAFDKRRTVVSKMYTESACMVWNGHPISTQQSIASFLENLPPSEHVVKCLDAQTVSEKVTNGQNTMLLHAAGTVRYQQERIRCFTETFIITQVKTETGDIVTAKNWEQFRRPAVQQTVQKNVTKKRVLVIKKK